MVWKHSETDGEATVEEEQERLEQISSNICTDETRRTLMLLLGFSLFQQLKCLQPQMDTNTVSPPLTHVAVLTRPSIPERIVTNKPQKRYWIFTLYNHLSISLRCPPFCKPFRLHIK